MVRIGIAPLLVLMLLGCDLVFPLHPPNVDAAASTDAGIADAPPIDTELIDTIAVAECPPFYIARPTGIYRLGTDVANAPAAEQRCEDDAAIGILRHTHLVVLQSQQALQDVIALAPTSTFWIGMTDAPTPFHWITAEAPAFGTNTAMPPWPMTEPSGDGPCVQLNGGNGELNDINCTTSIERYMCECDDFTGAL